MNRNTTRTKRTETVTPRPNGEVRCPCERHGRECGNLVGVLTPHAAQWYCRDCNTELIAQEPEIGFAIEIKRIVAILESKDAKPTRQTRVALLAQVETLASILRNSLFAEI